MVQERNQLRRCLGRRAVWGAGGIWALSALGCAPEKPSKAELEGSAVAAKASERAQVKASIEATAVALVNGEALSLGEFDRRVRELAEFARVRYATASQQQEWLDSVAQ